MLSNLQELQSNLQALIQQFSEVYNKYNNPQIAKKQNQSNAINKIPRIILILKICPFLQLKDIYNLSATNVNLRRMIFGPIGFSLMSKIMSPYPVIIKQRPNIAWNTNKNFYNEKQSQSILSLTDEKILKKARQQCKSYLMSLYEKHKINQQQYTQLVHQLKTQKTYVQKLKIKRQFFKQQKQNMQQKNYNYRTQLRQINEGFANKIEQLQQQNLQLQKQTNKLQNQKQALVGKIRQYQVQIENIKNESQKSKLILKKIKNYLLYKQL